MSDHAIRLPDIGEGVAQAEIAHWHVSVGDHLDLEQPFVDVMTDKATVELPSPVAGTVRELAGEVGDFVSVGAPLLWVSLDQPVLDDRPLDQQDATVATREISAPQPEPPLAAPISVADGRPRPTAAPAVRKRAAALGIDLRALPGTGPQGRVLHADLDAALTAALQHEPARIAGSTRIPLIGLRRNIARRMQEANRIPHFSYVESVDVQPLLALRAQLNQQHGAEGPRLTLLPFIIRAVTQALVDFPNLNARYDADNEVVEVFGAVHAGIAVQTSKGLMVAVVHHAEAADIWALGVEVRRLSNAAEAGTITLRELTGSTITITSLGTFGGLVSTPLINAPEVAIVAVNRIVEQPLLVDGQVQLRRVMNLSSSFDHRIVDGADAAGFIHRVRDLLQQPALMFIEPPGDR